MIKKIGFNKVIIDDTIQISRVSKSSIVYKDELREINFEVEIGDPTIIYFSQSIKNLNISKKQKIDIENILNRALVELDYDFELE